MQRSETKVDGTYTYEDVERMCEYIRSRLSPAVSPTVGVVCGTGLGSLAEGLVEQQHVEYKDIPGFPVSTVKGHKSRFVFGKIGQKEVVCMQGRFHLYEGYSPQMTVLPVRVMKLLGIKILIVTNAAGAVNETYNVGDLVMLKDQIFFPGFSGASPLRGPNDERFGTRFPSMSAAYDKTLRTLAREVANRPEVGVSDYLREGVYMQLGGPQFESVAENKMMKGAGADLVGMSTCAEVIAAVHCGLRVFGMSMVTNKSVVSYDSSDSPNHEEVLEAGRMRSKDIVRFMTALVEAMPIE